MRFRIYRFDPQSGRKPFLQDYEVRLEASDRKLLCGQEVPSHTLNVWLWLICQEYK